MNTSNFFPCDNYLDDLVVENAYCLVISKVWLVFNKLKKNQKAVLLKCYLGTLYVPSAMLSTCVPYAINSKQVPSGLLKIHRIGIQRLGEQDLPQLETPRAGSGRRR